MIKHTFLSFFAMLYNFAIRLVKELKTVEALNLMQYQKSILLKF
jgi:hypothetical protein